jgi:hypothetical protein
VEREHGSHAGLGAAGETEREQARGGARADVEVRDVEPQPPEKSEDFPRALRKENVLAPDLPIAGEVHDRARYAAVPQVVLNAGDVRRNAAMRRGIGAELEDMHVCR